MRDINILPVGYGGAFHANEKNSSFLMETQGLSILIDCGGTVYSELKKDNKIKDIDVVYITHMHDDHFGSLSTLIFDRFYLNGKTTNIECHENLVENLDLYLSKICKHDKTQYSINTFNSELVKLEKINTTGHHVPGLPSSGVILKFQNEDTIVYSGDINKPITELIDSNSLQYLKDNSESTLFLHEATTAEYDGNVHCNYKLLQVLTEEFPNIIVYHHSFTEAQEIKENSRLEILI